MELNANYWSNRYTQHQTGWDIGYSSTPLQEYMLSVKHHEFSILIPGCGNAYEASSILNMGFQSITLLDISPVLTAVLEQKFKDTSVQVLTGDFFLHQGQYDLILEQTFFCALDPALRSSYVQQMKKCLKPGGRLVGVLFNRLFEGGPPFGGSKAEYENLFKQQLTIKKMELCNNSIDSRKGTELFFIAENELSPAHLL